jgi:hypothetical protein
MAETGKNQGTYEVGKNKPPKATRFQKGKSGNEAGRPAGTRSTKVLLRKLLDTILDDENPLSKASGKYSVAELMHLKQIAKAMKDGDTRAYEAVFDRIDGRPTQTISNDPENPFDSGSITLVFNTTQVEPVTSEAAMQAIFDKFKDG